MRYDDWIKKGGKDMAARANERALKILAEHDQPSLPQAAEETIADVLKRREA